MLTASNTTSYRFVWQDFAFDTQQHCCQQYIDIDAEHTQVSKAASQQHARQNLGCQLMLSCVNDAQELLYHSDSNILNLNKQKSYDADMTQQRHQVCCQYTSFA